MIGRDGKIIRDWSQEEDVDIERDYNDDYSIKSETVWAGVIVLRKIVYEYDETGKLKCEREYDGHEHLLIEYNYDENKRVVKTMEYNEDGQMYEQHEYEYDESGLMKCEREYLDLGDPYFIDKYEYEFDTEGRVKSETACKLDGDWEVFSSKEEYIYGENGLVKCVREYDEYGEMIRETEKDQNGNTICIREYGNEYKYEYDEKGNLLSCCIYEDNKLKEEKGYDGDGNELYKHIYDETGIARSETYEYDDKDELLKTKVFEYDEEGNLLNEYEYDKDGKQISKRSYDSFGELISDDVHTPEEIADGILPSMTEIDAVTTEIIDGQVQDKNIAKQ